MKRPRPVRLVVSVLSSFVAPVALVLLAGCPPEVIPEPVIPKVPESEYCTPAEKNLRALGCEEGQPTKKGKTFAEFCKETQDNGIDLKPRCLSTIKSCDQIDKVCAWNR